jgi:hypothetical protein
MMKTILAGMQRKMRGEGAGHGGTQGKEQAAEKKATAPRAEARIEKPKTGPEIEKPKPVAQPVPGQKKMSDFF